MTAPALVLITNSTGDRSEQYLASLIAQKLQSDRPELSVHLVFSDAKNRQALDLFRSFRHRGMTEAVLVCLDISSVDQAPANILCLKEVLNDSYPTIKIQIAKPIGPAAGLLAVLDDRLRTALISAHSTELDALVFFAPSSENEMASELINRRMRQWASRHKLPVKLATENSFRTQNTNCVEQFQAAGRRAIAVGSFFLLPTLAYQDGLKRFLASGALTVSAPLGDDRRIRELIMARYAYASMEMLD